MSAGNEATAAVPIIDNRVKVVEDWSRRKYLCITGTLELPSEKTKQTMHAAIKRNNKILEVSQVKLDKNFRLKRTGSPGKSRQLRSIEIFRK